MKLTMTRMRIAVLSLLLLSILSASTAADADADVDVEVTPIIQEPTRLWSSSISGQPTAFHYSKSEELLYVFGHNPEQVVSLNPATGTTVEEVDLGDGASFGMIRSVAVRESGSRMDFAILTVDVEGALSGANSRVICWDFLLRIARWEFDVTAAGLTLPSVGKPAISDTGDMVFQHFAGGEVYGFNAFSGDVLWNKKFFPMAGWTYLNDSLYGGILTELGGNNISPGIYQLEAETGIYMARYRAPHQCFDQGSTYLALGQAQTRQQVKAVTGPDNCNNIWTNSVPSKSGQYIYFMDDLFGLMKFDANNIKAGPIWTNAFSKDSLKGSQQTYHPPVVSPDDAIIYASAHWTTAAIDANDGTTLWTMSQDDKWLTRDMLLSPYGDALFSPYNFAIHKIDTSSGKIEFETDTSLLNTFVALNSGATTIYTAGINVHAFATKVATGPPSIAPSNAPMAPPSVGATGAGSAASAFSMKFVSLTAAVLYLLL